MKPDKPACETIRHLLAASSTDPSPDHVAATLAWADGVERLDILIMEIRHIQSNLIHLLRKPRLLNLLRYEEIFIWGTVGSHGGEGHGCDGRNPSDADQAPCDWVDLFGQLDAAPDILAELSSFFVPPIDEQSTRTEGRMFEDVGLLEGCVEARRDLIASVADDLKGSLFSSTWGQEHRRNYHLFRALQRMKRNLVLAKLQLCWWGCWAYKLRGGRKGVSIEPDRLMHFMAVRAAVTVKLGEAIARLSDLQGQFERALDLGPQEQARPLGGRRRHGALSAAFLHNRSHELWVEMQQLMAVLGVKDANPEHVRPITTHRWNHDPLSSNHVIFDDTFKLNDVDETRSPAIDFLISSYWAPDRPDLQTMLAHEAAAAALRQRLPLADRMKLQDAPGILADLLRLLNQTIKTYETGGRPAPDDDAKDHLLPLLAADLLAAAIYGAAYLFALFQEFSGRGMEQLFRLPSGQIDLGIAEDAWTLSHLNGEIPLDWYVRIKVVCAWIKIIQAQGERSKLGITLVQGVEKLNDDLIARIHLLYHGEARSWPIYWHGLADRLCATVLSSPAAARVRAWRQERLQPYAVSTTKQASIRRTTRASRPMPPDLASFLRKTLITQKFSKPGRGLHRLTCEDRIDRLEMVDAVRFFDHLYLLDREQTPIPLETSAGTGAEDASEAEGGSLVKRVNAALRFWHDTFPVCPHQHKLEHLPFFRNLHDIPWESAIMRGLDFLDHLRTGQPDSGAAGDAFGPMSTLSLDFQPGRETFQVALEFQLLLTKRPADRLYNCVNLVKSILDNFGDVGVQQKLKTWFEEKVHVLQVPPEQDHAAKTGQKKVSIKDQLETWNGNDAADVKPELTLMDDINCLARLHRDGHFTDMEVRAWCKEKAGTTAARSLLGLGGLVKHLPERGRSADGDDGTWRWIDRSADYVLNRIQHEKLEQLTQVINHQSLTKAGLTPRQGQDPDILPAESDNDWKTISSLISLHLYLELNSSATAESEDDGEISTLANEKRVRSRQMILNALDSYPDTAPDGQRHVKDGRAIDIAEIGFLSVSESIDPKDKPKQQHDGNVQEQAAVDAARAERARLIRLLYEPHHMNVLPYRTGAPTSKSGSMPPKATYAACLGRFDRVVIADSSPLLTHRLPRFLRYDDPDDDQADGRRLRELCYRWDVPVLDDGRRRNEPSNDSVRGSTIVGDSENFFAYVQKREIALKLAFPESTTSDDEQVPLALVSIGLTQRYSRLEFIGRLLRAIRNKPKIGTYALEGLYHLIRGHDQAYLTDGAYDITLVLTGPLDGADQDYYDRFHDVLRTSITLHGDFMVDRTETHMLLPMIRSVMAPLGHRLSIIQEIRLKEYSEQQYGYRHLSEEFKRILEEQNTNILKAKTNGKLNIPKHLPFKERADLEAIQPKMYITPGRADVAIWYDSDWLKLYWQTTPSRQRTPSGLLDRLMNIDLKDWHVDRVATTIGVKPEHLLGWPEPPGS